MNISTFIYVFTLVFTLWLPVIDALSTNMTKNLKVLVSSNDFPDSAVALLEEHFTVLKSRYINFGEEGLNENKQELLNLIPGCSALIWVSHHQITKELLDKAGPQLKIVSTASAGYNNCNLPELKARGIKLTNTPDVLSAAVGEIAVSLMIAAARRFTENLDQVRRGEWEIGFQKVLGQDLRGSTVGIVGFGGIGQATAKRLAGFEVGKFIYTGHNEKPQDLINQDDLYDALKNNQIYAAGLDVTTPEPLPKDHKLFTLSNFRSPPHWKCYSTHTQ
ncbi:unnamed protein product [Leptidea sinapis]|uniref:D-isomer specific 2-hydroxyacid dehydrogenase NAD-binding domain-containing protein n=1 Tax=Leptidea sinapis TaxID=189913 RepID=A0A5E4PUP6_9NEOP|nr:unnamed protein product [Leptidea sinapis]